MGLVSLANGSKLRYSVTHDKYHKWKRVVLASGCLYACPSGGLGVGVKTGYPINEALKQALPRAGSKSLAVVLYTQTKFNALSAEEKANVTRAIGNIAKNVTRKALPAFRKFRTAWMAGNMPDANSCFVALRKIPLQYQADEHKPLFNMLKGAPQAVDRPTSPVSVVYASRDQNAMNVFSFMELLGLDTAAAAKRRSKEALEKWYKFGTSKLKKAFRYADVQLISGDHLSLRGGQTELKEMLTIIQK